MLKEFKEFAFKGNLVDMAVGFILGTGFATVIKSLVTHVIMPPLGLVLADVDFTKMKWVLKEAEGEKPEVAMAYGLFLTETITFLMLAFVVFLVVKKVIAALEKKEEPAPTEPTRQEVLLEEIRDALKNR